ncbi:Ku protein [Streptomyces sp. NPDC001975]
MPVHVAGATEDHSVRFHQYHVDDMARVRVRVCRYCEVEGREVRSGGIAKGYERTKSLVIPITEGDRTLLPRSPRGRCWSSRLRRTRPRPPHRGPPRRPPAAARPARRVTCRGPSGAVARVTACCRARLGDLRVVG